MIIFAYGLPGTGKSTLLHDLVVQHSGPKSVWRLFVFDHEQGWGPDALFWRGKPPRDLYIIDGPEALEELYDAEIDDWPPNGVWVFQRCTSEDIAKLALHVGNVTYVDDEIDTAARREGWDKSSLRRIAHEGRHILNAVGDVCHCHIIGACRRPQNLHTDVADMVAEVYVFRIQGDRTIQRLLSDSVIEKDQWEVIRNQPDFHYYHWPSRTFDVLESVGTPRGTQAADPSGSTVPEPPEAADPWGDYDVDFQW